MTSPSLKNPIGSTLLACFFATFAVQGAGLEIDAAFPGGNIKVDRIEDYSVFLRQDLRDTKGYWFYRAFRARGAAGRTLRFTFPGDVFPARGPAISTDAGLTWKWMGREVVAGNAFSHTFAPDAGDVRFSMGMTYTETNLNAFLRPYLASGVVKSGTLCRTKKGRDVEILHFGRTDGEPRLRVFLVAR